MHQKHYEDNNYPWKPTYLLLTQDELNERVYPTFFLAAYEEDVVRVSDVMVYRITNYVDHSNMIENEWLLSEDEMFLDQGCYNKFRAVYIDCDEIVDSVNKIIDKMREGL